MDLSFRMVMPLAILLLAVGSLSFQTKVKKKKRKPLKKSITQTLPFGAWMHSHEEDVDRNSESKTYRKSSFNFPPARGRSGFILLADHKMGLIYPSPNDGRDTTWGTWSETKTKGLLDISFVKTPVTHFEASLKNSDVWLVKMW